MNKNNQFFVLIIILLVLSAVGGFFVGNRSKNINSSNQQQFTETTLKSYTSKNLGFSFDYPSSLGNVSEVKNAVVLPGDTSEQWMYQISVDSTKLTTIQDWLNSQPKGSTSVAGIKPVLWIGTDTVLVEEYMIVDYNGARPIFGKRLDSYTIRGGKVIKVAINRQLNADSVSVIDPDALSIITSLK